MIRWWISFDDAVQNGRSLPTTEHDGLAQQGADCDKASALLMVVAYARDYAAAIRVLH